MYVEHWLISYLVLLWSKYILVDYINIIHGSDIVEASESVTDNYVVNSYPHMLNVMLFRTV